MKYCCCWHRKPRAIKYSCWWYRKPKATKYCFCWHGWRGLAVVFHDMQLLSRGTWSIDCGERISGKTHSNSWWQQSFRWQLPHSVISLRMSNTITQRYDIYSTLCASRLQVSLTPSFAITEYKVQGATFRIVQRNLMVYQIRPWPHGHSVSMHGDKSLSEGPTAENRERKVANGGSKQSIENEELTAKNQEQKESQERRVESRTLRANAQA